MSFNGTLPVMKRLLSIGLIVVVVLIVVLLIIWFNAQPVWPVDRAIEIEKLKGLPVTNSKVIKLIEIKGRDLAPTYKSAVCTEFVINVIDKVNPLTKTEKNDIRIITNSRLDSLIDRDSPSNKGCTNGTFKKQQGYRDSR